MTESLTGAWDGTYVQQGRGMVTFQATLTETGGALGGTVTEPCHRPGCPIATHNASISGQRSGSAVSFVKSYDPPGNGFDTVFYEGSVNADATEIDVRWRLPNGLSGLFLMIRSTKTAQATVTEVRVKQPVR